MCIYINVITTQWLLCVNIKSVRQIRLLSFHKKLLNNHQISCWIIGTCWLMVFRKSFIFFIFPHVNIRIDVCQSSIQCLFFCQCRSDFDFVCWEIIPAHNPNFSIFGVNGIRSKFYLYTFVELFVFVVGNS